MNRAQKRILVLFAFVGAVFYFFGSKIMALFGLNTPTVVGSSSFYVGNTTAVAQKAAVAAPTVKLNPGNIISDITKFFGSSAGSNATSLTATLTPSAAVASSVTASSFDSSLPGLTEDMFNTDGFTDVSNLT